MPQLTSASAQETAGTGSVPCPRCKQPLVDPSGLGWCKACGYCRSLADTEKGALPQIKPAAAKQPAPPGAGKSFSMKWVIPMFLGMALVGGATYVGSRYLVLSPLQRALLTSVQIALAFLAMFIGQLIGLLKVGPEESSLSFMDAIFPFRLYPMLLKRLPRTRLTIYSGAWGVTAIITAVVFIGGLDYWFTYLPGNKNNPNRHVHKAKSN